MYVHVFVVVPGIRKESQLWKLTQAISTITCNSSHLTSFAVLVDVAGGHQVIIMHVYVIYTHMPS